MKTVFPPSHHHNGFVATHARRHNHVTWAHDIWAPGHMNCTSCASVHELPQSYCGDDQEGTLFS